MNDGISVSNNNAGTVFMVVIFINTLINERNYFYTNLLLLPKELRTILKRYKFKSMTPL
jgi:hypothetical protein